MKHYILYYHGGSGNHGCEALVRTTAELLDYKKNRISLMSFRPNEDKKYGIEQFCDIHSMNEKKKVPRKSYTWIKSYIMSSITHNKAIMEDLPFLNAIGAKKGDVALSIGGDNYCYNDTFRLRKANELWRRNGIKTVLWGCSIEPELLNNPEIAEDISRFDLITARESISYEAIKRVNSNTVLVSDSALGLKTKGINLPFGLVNNGFVGLNISPLARSCESVEGITNQNIERLIQFILAETKMDVLLIPHVTWSHDDDRIMNEYYRNRFLHSKRVFCIEEKNCEEIKGHISHCRFFVGARTHATIAAYSSGIPTLVIGYSVKSKGIARDLFGSEENYVISVDSLKDETDLMNGFIWLMNNEDMIINQLSSIIPEYRNRIGKGIEAIRKL